MKKLIFAGLLGMLLIGQLYAQERKIKAGDTIEIVVYGHQELSRTVTVSPQGTVDFPFMQNLPVDGQTTEKLREIIVAQLSRYLDTFPVVTVGFAKSNTISVQVLGMVSKPGLTPVPLNSTLQGALSEAGNVLPAGRLNEVTITRTVDGKQVTSSYDLESFLMFGDPKQNPIVSEGDVIMVTGNPLQTTVKVFGEVRSPGSFKEFAGATVFDMIMAAGGPTAEASISHIRYISPSRKKTIEFKLDVERYMTSQEYTQLPVVKPGDLIFVPKKKKLWTGLLGIIRDVSSISIALYYIVRIQKQ